MIKNKKIFITGGAGFISTKIVERLIKNNHITIYDNFSRDSISKTKLVNNKNLQIIKGDILNYNKLVSGMKNNDIVVHAAAIAGIATVIKDPVLTMKVNMIGTANVLEAAYKNNIKDKIIEFSTSEIFGNYAYKSNEKANAVAGSAGEARWSYSVSKLAGEHLAAAYYKKYKLPVVSIRPFNIYGPGQTGEGAMMIFIKRALKNQNIYIYGEGSQIRTWCYVDDFVDCLIKIIENKNTAGESFNIGNSKAIVTIYGLAQNICRVLNSKSKIIFRKPLSADVELRIPSVDKIKNQLNFQSKVNLDEGILKTAKWIKNSI